MNLGESIYQLRTARNMSQGDLADALDVSRQSVSKWENNMAVPELDKLVKMSELFGVSLDTLVHGTVPADGTTDVPQTPNKTKASAENSFPPRKIAGIILFCMAFLTELVCTALGGMLEGLVFASPFLLCGIICFVFRRNVGLWCTWTVFAIADVYLSLATGASRGLFSLPMLFTHRLQYSSPISIIVSAVLVLWLLLLFILTLIRFRKLRLDAQQNRILLLSAGWLIWILIPILLHLLVPSSPAISAGDGYRIFRALHVVNVLVNWIRIPLFTTLCVRTLAVLRSLRKQK
ncbi:MAG: helix-turn-helix transcriptional regulator [Clostridia bacterium]|nr:helix-turn-helix transcriptional regulator [Clostridia bacterium]